jgi:hypothetical protein
MRYYEIHLPNQKGVQPVTSVRKLRDLPEGTHIECVVTDRDGGPLDSWSIPVVDGRADLKRGRAKHRARFIGGLR